MMGREPRDMILAVWGMSYRIKAMFFDGRLYLVQIFGKKHFKHHHTSKKHAKQGGPEAPKGWLGSLRGRKQSSRGWRLF